MMLDLKLVNGKFIIMICEKLIGLIVKDWYENIYGYLVCEYWLVDYFIIVMRSINEIIYI